MKASVKIQKETKLMALANLATHIEVRKCEIKARFKVVHQVMKEFEEKLLKQLEESYEIILNNSELESVKNIPNPIRRVFSQNKGREKPSKCQNNFKIPYYQIDWDSSMLETFRNNFCTIRKLTNDYATCSLSKHYKMSENITLDPCNPEGVAVSIDDLKIYVADYGNNRILVADQSSNQIVQEITSDEIKWPQYVCVDGDFLYVSCYGNNHLVKIDRFKGVVVASVDTGKKITGVTTDEKGQLYTCEVEKHEITVWTLELEIVKSFQLVSSYISAYTSTWDVKIQGSKLFVLFENSDFPVQVFDLEGKLLNKLIGESRLDQCCHFGLDAKGNIVVNEYQTGCIKVFSNTGELMHSTKDLKFPAGVGFGSLGKIVLCNNQALFELH